MSGRIDGTCLPALFLGLGMLTHFLVPGAAMQIVKSGQARSVIVVPDEPLEVVSYAAIELQYHLQQASGATLPIVRESDKSAGSPSLYLGPCRRTLAVVSGLPNLPANGFVIKLSGADLFLAGHDGSGSPMSIATHAGTLFAVYEFLEREMGVKWLWPGKLGEVIPERKDLEIRRWNQTGTPRFTFARWRNGKGQHLIGPQGWSSPAAQARYLNDENVWLRRHRFAMGSWIRGGHAFSDYWAKYGESHPEYFNLLPDNTRRPDPTISGGARPDLVSMCVSQPGLWKLVPHFDEHNYVGSENDVNARCTCQTCLSWDEPDPESPVPFDQRLEYARRSFQEGGESRWAGWPLHLGSLSDRYARFWLAIQQEAVKTDPEAVVWGVAYANTTNPPRKVKLNDRIIVHIVPGAFRSGGRGYVWMGGFPWTRQKQEAFRKQWKGWSLTGARLLLRPNYTLPGHNMPIFYARRMAEDFTLAANSKLMAGTDFDSLTGQWATQGPNLYVLARLHRHPDWSADRILEEYYTGFGPARSAVRAYFRHWEVVCDAVTDEFIEEQSKLLGYQIYNMADALFPAEVMAKGRALLDRARAAAKAHPTARARVDFLAKGFRHAELTMVAGVAHREYQRTGDSSGFAKALKQLDDYRKSVEADNVANMSWLVYEESLGKHKSWDRSVGR